MLNLSDRQPMRDLIPSDLVGEACRKDNRARRAFLQYRGVYHRLPQSPPPLPIFPCHFD